MGHETQADLIRGKICKLLMRAHAEGENPEPIRAGDIQDRNLPNVCSAMTGGKMRYACPGFQVEILHVRDNQGRTGSAARPSTNFWVTYKIVADSNSKSSEVRIAPSQDGKRQNTDAKKLEGVIQDGAYTLEERLRALNYMKEVGNITDDEFNAKIREILDRL